MRNETSTYIPRSVYSHQRTHFPQWNKHMHMCNSVQFHLAMAGIECTGVYRTRELEEGHSIVFFHMIVILNH